ncbi:MAG TPA: response regulator [Aquabacterium sp.]|nr:response regulator [Aquabacterium sp.]
MSHPVVLIVDDEPINLVLMESLLEDHHPVETFGSAQDALTRLNQSSEDVGLIISDVLMPGMDGYQLCRSIRSNPATHDLPVILVSSLDREEDEAAGLQAGASDLVAKPYSPELLLARARTQLRVGQMQKILQQHGLPVPL